MVVEDDAELASDLAQALATMGYEVVGASASAEACLAEVARLEPDLVLMDIGLEGELDGIDAAKLLRDGHDLPVVFLSGHADDRTMRRAGEAGALGYLLKPFRPSELKSTVEVALFRHHLERQLRDRAAWLSATLRAIGDAAVALDGSGAITFMNAAAEALLGVREADARGRPLSRSLRLINESTREPLADPLRGAITDGEVERWPQNTALVTAERELPVHVRVAPLRDGQGRVSGGVVVIQDLTERRRAQQQVAAADRLASLAMVAAGIAHEINNPLTYVCGNVELMTEELARLNESLREPATAESLASARDGLALLADLAADVQQGALDVARIVGDLGAFARREERGDPCDVVERMQWALRVGSSAILRHADVKRVYRPVPKAGVDEGRLGQVFLNILLNAAYAMRSTARERNELTVTIEPDEAGDPQPPFIRISIADTGTGMTPDVLKRIFDPFFTTKPPGAGSGLGLAVCQGLVQEMGGELSVTSSVGVGSCFVVRVPAAGPAGRRSVAPPSLSGARGRVLVIDDDPGVLAVLGRLLGGVHEVVSARSAERGLTLLEREAFDAIVCDVLMPGTDGVAFYREVSGRWPELARRILFISGGVPSQQDVAFFASIPNPTLQKPPDTHELLLAIEALLPAPGASGAPGGGG